MLSKRIINNKLINVIKSNIPLSNNASIIMFDGNHVKQSDMFSNSSNSSKSINFMTLMSHKNNNNHGHNGRR